MAELWREIPAQPLKWNMDNSNNNHYQIKKLSKTRCLFSLSFLQMLHLAGGLKMDTCSKRWVCNCSNAHFIDVNCFSLCAVLYFLWPAPHSLELFIRFLISCPHGVKCSTEFTAVVIFPYLSTCCNSCHCAHTHFTRRRAQPAGLPRRCQVN